MNGAGVMNGVERAARGPWMQRAAAFGFVARGVVYGVVGVYALTLALGHGGGFLDASDTPRAVKRQPFGDVLLVLLGIGLACHALWRFVEAVAPPPEASGMKRLGKRLASIGQGLVAAFLAATAFQHLVGRSTEHGSWLQRVLRWDHGDQVVLVIGLGFLAGGVYQLYRAVTRGYRRDVRTDDLSPAACRWLLRVCRFGVAVRGAVLLVIGALLVRVGLHVERREEVGTGAALRAIMQQSSGTWLLAVAAAGLIAYALFLLATARHHRALA